MGEPKIFFAEKFFSGGTRFFPMSISSYNFRKNFFANGLPKVRECGDLGALKFFCCAKLREKNFQGRRCSPQSAEHLLPWKFFPAASRAKKF